MSDTPIPRPAGAASPLPLPDGPDRDTLLRWYHDMLLIRRVEEQAAKAYTLKKITGFCHLYIGQEAVAVGAIAALRPDDPVIGSYREHGQILARGVDPAAVLAELFGKATGVCRGVGGSMHLVSAEHHFWGGYGIVGAHIPLGAGAAFAARYRQRVLGAPGTPNVSLTFFGDGAAQQGAFFESLALAQLWKLPAVFLCENNFYAMGTSLDRQSHLTDMSRRGDGVGMLSWQFDGFDVVDVYRNVKAAVDHARAGLGPVLLEAVTYRYRGHSMSDPAKYRPQGELEAKQEQKDGLKLAEVRLRAAGVDEAALTKIAEDVKAVAKAAYDAADKAPLPDPAQLYDYTWATPSTGAP